MIKQKTINHHVGMFRHLAELLSGLPKQKCASAFIFITEWMCSHCTCRRLSRGTGVELKYSASASVT